MRTFFYGLYGNSDTIKLKIHPAKGQRHSRCTALKNHKKNKIFENLIKMQFAMKIKEKYKQITKKTLFLNKFFPEGRQVEPALWERR